MSENNRNGHKGTQVRLTTLMQVLLDKKVEDIVVLHVGDTGAFCDYFIIGSVGSERQARAVYQDCLEEIHRLRWQVVGRDAGESYQWLVFDFGDIVIHLFQHQMRKYYDLENLWCSAPRIEKSINSDDSENL